MVAELTEIFCYLIGAVVAKPCLKAIFVNIWASPVPSRKTQPFFRWRNVPLWIQVEDVQEHALELIEIRRPL